MQRMQHGEQDKGVSLVKGCQGMSRDVKGCPGGGLCPCSSKLTRDKRPETRRRGRGRVESSLAAPLFASDKKEDKSALKSLACSPQDLPGLMWMRADASCLMISTVETGWPWMAETCNQWLEAEEICAFVCVVWCLTSLSKCRNAEASETSVPYVGTHRLDGFVWSGRSAGSARKAPRGLTQGPGLVSFPGVLCFENCGGRAGTDEVSVLLRGNVIGFLQLTVFGGPMILSCRQPGRVEMRSR
ncbi:hypothetical protein BJ875DRAFT_130759 [Amylocarpus encephaloides]|uniref:Uncharacterized protein n=1 Tax=Amylocarpus encephaloides TaxID=45428 RepID=A0A9P8C2L6_9HELO|nr:hypothetical protein BJ875DRAFT_130759 [Amylocarpus encephaloides]